MIKRSKVIMSFLCSIILSSCSLPLDLNESSEYNPRDLFSRDYPFAKETALEVIRCLDSDDSEALKSLISDDVVLGCNIDERINELFDFYKGKSVSYERISSGIQSSEYRKDHYQYKAIEIDIDDILTDENESYSLELWYVLVDDENPSQIGISKIFFRNDEGVPLLKLTGIQNEDN